MNRSATVSRPVFTPRQGQYLAFIHAYTLVNGRPPAEADMMRFFRVTPPAVHQPHRPHHLHPRRSRSVQQPIFAPSLSMELQRVRSGRETVQGAH
jgi:hypothetical protein